MPHVGPDRVAAIMAPDRAPAFGARRATAAMAFTEPQSTVDRVILQRHDWPGVVTPLDPAMLGDMPGPGGVPIDVARQRRGLPRARA
ncbi:hypothetical protein GWK16_18315 [Roseomonas sp. JC162]|uniref:Uncharacterized protein n=1 Tax=Neoroseomonas marina TaxID=1232220 RepID=A0A848EIJ1_9PROT|nr:hypothetical protein [Neoroseomonas marina]NMJ43208.1 hypothetical protein [Neoroseomonas marina]